MEISPIYTTAPTDARIPQEAACYALLEELNIPYIRIDHDATDTMEDCAVIAEVLQATICKNLLLTPRNRSAFYLLCMAPDKPFTTKDFSKIIGSSRLSFATGEDMVELLGCHIGSASILGLMNDPDHRITLAMDRSIAESEWFGCHPCKNTSSLRIATKDILEKFLPHTGHSVTVVDL